LAILWLTVTIPAFFLLPTIDAIEGYSKLSAILWSVANLATIGLIVLCRVLLSMQWFDPAKQPRMSSLHQGIMDFLMVAVLVLISHEGSLLASLVWQGRFFDAEVQAVEHAAWACQPSVELHQMLNSKTLGCVPGCRVIVQLTCGFSGSISWGHMHAGLCCFSWPT